MKKEDSLIGFILVFIGIIFSILITLCPIFEILFRTDPIRFIFWCGTAYIPDLILVGSGVWMIFGKVEQDLTLEIVLVIYLAFFITVNYLITASLTGVVCIT